MLLMIDLFSNYYKLIDFPNELVKVEGACILSSFLIDIQHSILDGVIAKAENLYILDNIYYDSEEFMYITNKYTLLIRMKLPLPFNNCKEFGEHLYNKYKNKMNRIINNTIKSNCDKKNISKIINDFQGDDKDIKFKLITKFKNGNKFNNTSEPITIGIFSQECLFRITSPIKEIEYYLGLFNGYNLISLSDEIFIDERYCNYNHPNIPQLD